MSFLYGEVASDGHDAEQGSEFCFLFTVQVVWILS